MKKAGKSKMQEEWEARNLPKKEKEPKKDAGLKPVPFASRLAAHRDKSREWNVSKQNWNLC